MEKMRKNMKIVIATLGIITIIFSLAAFYFVWKMER
jgi:uncharacterized protein YpmB